MRLLFVCFGWYWRIMLAKHLSEDSMKNIHCLIEARRRIALIKRLENDIRIGNELVEGLEYGSDVLMFIKSNAQIVLMNLKDATREMRNTKIREAVYMFSDNLIGDGKNSVRKEDLFKALDELDQKINVKISEFFNLKDVLIIDAAKVFENISSEAIRIQKMAVRAEAWMAKSDLAPESDDLFFLEHALKVSRDQDKPEKREVLLKQLSFIGRTEDSIVETYSKTMSDMLIRLSNSVSLIHLVKNIDWLYAYETLSRTEKILISDTGKVYQNMDEESRSCIRRSLEEMSMHSGFSENSIASMADLLVKEGCFSDITEALYTDYGREKVTGSLNRKNKPIRKMTPDPYGHKLITFQIAGTLALFGISILVFPMTACVFLFPVLWAVVSDTIRFLASKIDNTYPLLSLKMEEVPDQDRTLVVIPALLTSAESARKIAARLHEHGIHEKDKNIDYLLLGDFKDSEIKEQESDKEIMTAVTSEIERMNSKSERKKYYYLQRERTFLETDGIWMGRERKRGAIEDLNRLIVTGENRFLNAAELCMDFFRKYTYLLTMDSDSKILPGETKKLIGMMSHPLNSSYNVIQPRMETIPGNRRNLFSDCMSGVGGTDHYDVCASDFYQDLTGEGIFSGKGIIRIDEFYDRTNEAFQENTVLSHDMIEGILTKAAYAGNRVMFESFPDTTEGFLKRLDRWTRGDWQLVHYLFGRIKLNALGRFKIFSNLVRSLESVSVLITIVFSIWHQNLLLLTVGLTAHFLPVFLNGIGALSPSVMSFLLLPDISYTELRAALTALFRLYISKRKRLEWTTAAETVIDSGYKDFAGITSAIFLVPGLLDGRTILFAIAIGISFAFGKPLITYMTKNGSDDSLTAENYGYLFDLSKRIWRYFEKYVPLNGNGLPPDNVQLDPCIGIQNRTSPTNIGMYILSVIGAGEMGIIEKNEAAIRLRSTLGSLKTLETYKGLFFNWYDITNMKPVYPRFVSSVDLGNLMAACVAARNYFSEDENLSNGYQEIIDRMEIHFLYNKKRKLFTIGYDAENDKMSASFYDLYASEARILSYTAMAEKGIAIEHWKRLGRPFSFIHKKPVPLSWSGTMFEYMMPSLILPTTSRSFMRNMEKDVIRTQIRSNKGGIWGISESGYAAFDRQLNYQYQAFGIHELALSGDKTAKVFSPYSVILSIIHSRESGIRCLERMDEMGLKGECGFYEAVDMEKETRPQIIYSYMTHHQGMSFVALANVLTGNKLQALFVMHPKESALLPLLSEKPLHALLKQILFAKKKEHMYAENDAVTTQKPSDFSRWADKSLHEGHLLSNGDVNLYFEPMGRSFLRKGGIYANRFSADQEEHNTILPTVTDKSGKALIKRCLFDTGYVEYELATQRTYAKISCTINPENGHMLMKVEIHSLSNEIEEVTVDHNFPLALSDEESMYAHPVFQDLFVKELPIDKNGKMYLRKDRDTLKEELCLIHLTDGDLSPIKEKTHGKHASLRRVISIEPYRKHELYFEIAIEKHALENVKRPSRQDFERAQIILRTQMNAHIKFCGLKASEYRQADRNLKNMFSLRAKQGNEILDPKCLWGIGLSGETPILLSFVTQNSSVDALKKLIRVREFYRYVGYTLPLVIVHVRETEYFTPLTDAIKHILSSSYPGGTDFAYVLNEDDLSKEMLNTLKAISVMTVRSDFLKDTANKRRLADNKEACEYAKITQNTKPESLIEDNGYGGFEEENPGYQIYVTPGNLPPRRWSNFIANADFGVMTNDIGIAHIYYENSRTGRITPFENNLDLPAPAVELYGYENGKKLSLTPGVSPKGAYTVKVRPGETVYTCETENVIYHTTCFVDAFMPAFYIKVECENKGKNEIMISFSAKVRYLMGTDTRDLRFTRIDGDYAMGKCGFTVYSNFQDDQKEIVLTEGMKENVGFVLFAYKGKRELNTLTKSITDVQNESIEAIKAKFEKMIVDTGVPARDKMVNGFLKAQTLFSRFYARFGPYQPGGAFGMRDQMQDLLSIMYFDLEMTRRHLLLCASKQFEKGDALHWWHMPSNGVRTRISDDILFLPVVASKYIELSEDRGILSEKVAFLKDEPIPDGQEDLYKSFESTAYTSTFYDHIIRAFRYANKRGRHGLLLMGSGDWNDGMNKVGHLGMGESVWLSEFFVYASKLFLPYANEEDKEYLLNEAESLTDAIEKHAWDGEWYIRAFDDMGNKIGSRDSRECRIDLITQAWAVIAGLNEERSKTAVRSAEKFLIDREHGYIRLLTPPFKGEACHPGYISAYPEGVRENGGQYTHAACWLVKAYAKLQMGDDAWKAFDMLLPIDRTNTKEKAEVYGGEPYVIAADISDNKFSKGVCGWTWYTGAAAWAERVLIEDLLGISIKGKKVTMNALLPKDKDTISITIKEGRSLYKLTAKRDSKETARIIEMVEDGLNHEFEFPVRK